MPKRAAKQELREVASKIEAGHVNSLTWNQAYIYLYFNRSKGLSFLSKALNERQEYIQLLLNYVFSSEKDSFQKLWHELKTLI